ncbi:MAG: hypothetical protein Q8M00_00355 [bacterium]|nr:hypothetical protein [bacterium]
MSKDEKSNPAEAGKGLDIGTAFIYCAQKIGPQVTFRIQRNAFFDIEYSEFVRGMFESSGVKYIQSKDKIYVMGEDALKFANVFGRNLRRPMKNGVMSPQEKEALPVMEVIIKSVLGLPSEKEEICYYSVPGSPVDADFDIVYHQNIIKGFLEKLGYRPKPINEGLTIVFSELAEDNFTGMGISFGGGVANICLAIMGIPTFSFSVARAGDWIDEQVARVTNQSVSRVTTFKETSLNLKKPESSMNKTEQALSIYYNHLIEYILEQIKKEFLKNPPQLEAPLPIVISGGTANPSGFIERFRGILKKADFPLPVKEVRLAPHPLYTTAKGALIAAIADSKK